MVKQVCLVFILTGVFSVDVLAERYSGVLVQEGSHPAVQAAAVLMAKKLGLPDGAVQTAAAVSAPQAGQIVLAVQTNKGVDHDGYRIEFKNGGAVISGNRPRSLLYAAGDVHLWKDKTGGEFVRRPSFGIRAVELHGSMPMPDYTAATGLNLLIDRKARASVSFKETLPEVFSQLPLEEQGRLSSAARGRSDEPNPTLKACRDADIEYYAFLYGNNMQLWSEPLYQAAMKAYPAARGTPAAHSWEQASLCPSEPATWKLMDAYLREYLTQTQADGLYVTFWDDYGLYCQCDRCRASGMNTFANQLHACVQQYYKTVSSMGKKLVVRTWSSGVPHWLEDQWVHAPGYDHFGGSGEDLWKRVFRELPADIIIQTKVYHADCQPDPPFSPLLGRAAPHTEIAEYQMTGQTTGRYYFPASTVHHTARTMKKALQCVGPRGGVNLFLGGTRQTEYFLLDDILNSVNVYAWRELSWNVDADPKKIFDDWAAQIYDEKAAGHIARAMELSEDAVNRTFSTLGMGSSTNSDFVKTIARRETLLMYTNRHFVPEFSANLEPTRENIQRVIDEKKECLDKIEQMFSRLEKARPYLTKAQEQELTTRFEWLRQFAITTRWLEESLFRFRYLRYLNSMRTTDPEQMKFLAEAYDKVSSHSPRLFRYDSKQRFACYSRPLGQLTRQPARGNPMPLMKDIYTQSKTYVEEIVGPDYLPAEWSR
jgi:hypothetical protein